MAEDCERCPPAIKLKSLCKDFDKLESAIKEENKELWKRRDEDYLHWEGEVGQRVKTRTLIAIVGIVTTIVLALLGFSFHSLTGAMEKQLLAQGAVHEDVVTMQRTVDRMEIQLESVKKDVDRQARETRRRSRTSDRENTH